MCLKLLIRIKQSTKDQLREFQLLKEDLLRAVNWLINNESLIIKEQYKIKQLIKQVDASEYFPVSCLLRVLIN
jgi:hypothetical protein